MVVHIILALLPIDGFQHTRTYMASTSADGQERAWQEHCELLTKHSKKNSDLANLAFHSGGEVSAIHNTSTASITIIIKSMQCRLQPAGAASFSTAMEQVVAVVSATDPLQAWLLQPQHSRIGSLENSSTLAGVLSWHITVSRTYSSEVEKANKRKADSQPGSNPSKQQDRAIERTVLSLMWPAYHGQLQTSAHTAQSKNGVTPIADKAQCEQKYSPPQHYTSYQGPKASNQHGQQQQSITGDPLDFGGFEELQGFHTAREPCGAATTGHYRAERAEDARNAMNGALASINT
ncbi:hypothetical protein HaLaN_29236, partial [Haematococcus lacustris]